MFIVILLLQEKKFKMMAKHFGNVYLTVKDIDGHMQNFIKNLWIRMNHYKEYYIIIYICLI
uniref:Uncharacterized protein n=1 Tax=viral metagenome TaxID=1070528 RepID=A0A6C0IUU1_9ZZZZ